MDLGDFKVHNKHMLPLFFNRYSCPHVSANAAHFAEATTEAIPKRFLFAFLKDNKDKP